MSGHSKWSQIKRKKQAKDQVKGNVFSKLSRLISLSVIEGGGVTDPDHNVKLRLCIEKAKQMNMPKENINRAIERGLGPDKNQLKEVFYEAFIPDGISLIIFATTDNPNRTLSDVRNVLIRHEGKLGNQGSVMHFFEKCGFITLKKDEVLENKVYEFAQNSSAFDIDEDGHFYYLYIPFELIGKAREKALDIKIDSIEIDFKPKMQIDVENEARAKKILATVDALEDLDDVHKVYGNFSIADSYLNNLSL